MDRRGPRWIVARVVLGVGCILATSVSSIALSSCGGRPEQKPIADSTMVELLVELHLANARIEVTDRPLPVPRDSILHLHGVDSASYGEAVAYYADHPEEYSRVYGLVLDRLSAERGPLEDAPPPDSLPIRASEAPTRSPGSQ